MSDCVQWSLLIIGCFFLPWMPSAAAERKFRSLAEFEIAPDGDFIFLPVIINRREYPFLVCTGLATTVIDQDLRDELELPLLETHNGSGRENNRYRLHARLGSADLNFVDGVEIGDYTSLREGLDLDIHGEIGMDVLRGQIVQIDFDEGVLRFLPAVPPDSGEAVNILQKEYGVPILELVVADEKPERFFVSTGRAGNSLEIDSRLLDELEMKNAATILAKERGLHRSGTRSLQAVRLKEIRIGKFRHKEIIANAGEGNSVHLSYLSRYLVTFDFRRGKMHLKKGMQYGIPDAKLDLSQVAVVREDRSTFVTQVNCRGPAERLGLRAGDRLEMLNDRRVGRMSTWHIRQVLGRADLPLTAEVIREGKSVQLRSEPLEMHEPAKGNPP